MGPAQTAAGAHARTQAVPAESGLRVRLQHLRSGLAAAAAALSFPDPRSGSGVPEGSAVAAQFLPAVCFAQHRRAAAISHHTGAAAVDMVSPLERIAELCASADRAAFHDPSDY